ncbi:hypothetical protein SMICM17S_12786 [Streptomyces microflavus]
MGTIDSPEWRIADREASYLARAVAARIGLWGEREAGRTPPPPALPESLPEEDAAGREVPGVGEVGWDMGTPWPGQARAPAVLTCADGACRSASTFYAARPATWTHPFGDRSADGDDVPLGVHGEGHPLDPAD